MASYDDGTGPALYAGGAFTTAGGAPANYIAKWDGVSWLPLGSGLGGGSNGVYALTVFDDGGGPALYAGGDFYTADGQPASYVAKWRGGGWLSLGSGTNSAVRTLFVFEDGSGPALYAGGLFTTAGGIASSYIAKWTGCPPAPCTGDIDADADVDLSDLATLLSNFGTPSGATPEQGDLDGDHDVDLQDLANLLANFGTNC
ncbi:MAG: hypothetical protein HZB38_12230 [Planctomycetes bacterium]|nr:hypothetical protein [Planctomycetota bacterium]